KTLLRWIKLSLTGSLLVLLLTFPQLASAQSIPPLPKSRTCHKDDVVGLWQMRQIYQVPAGQELRMYQRFPSQYFLYRPDDTYMVYITTKNKQPPHEVFDQMNQRKVPWLWQFIVDKSGFLFIYRNGKPVNSETEACFIVAKSTRDFDSGEMILMPPEGKVKERLVKVYKKIWTINK
ncbi:MAG: hypothetical protein KGJ06_09405, partial [Pseudomonadota bacterium]|nr:hypothetical protein [Pseudomonadota bacterium]